MWKVALSILSVPAVDLDAGLGARAIDLAARLAAADDRLATWANSIGVASGPLATEEMQAKIEELDAVVARLYGLTRDLLAHIFDTFHDWVDDRTAKAWIARRDRTVGILQSLP